MSSHISPLMSLQHAVPTTNRPTIAYALRPGPMSHKEQRSQASRFPGYTLKLPLTPTFSIAGHLADVCDQTSCQIPTASDALSAVENLGQTDNAVIRESLPYMRLVFPRKGWLRGPMLRDAGVSCDVCTRYKNDLKSLRKNLIVQGRYLKHEDLAI